jgi:hypothetical protein
MKKLPQSGFTLIELTLVLGISVMIASTLIGLFKAHVQMMTKSLQNNFVAQDAPFIGLLLTRTMANAEDFRIYASGSNARSNTAPVLSGPAVRLWMRQPNSTFRQAVISYETVSGHAGIYFWVTDLANGTFTVLPSWELAGGSLTAALFQFDSTTLSPADPHQGVLLVKLTGTYNDWYKFAAEKK